MNHWVIIVVSIGLGLSLAHAEVEPLESQLDKLKLPTNAVGTLVSREKLYSVQDRYVPLHDRFELSLAGSEQVSDTGFIAKRDVSLGFRYYLDSKWSFGGSYSYVFNRLTESTNNFLNERASCPW